MMGQMLIGSVILPLGDFSLMKELPRMYQAYEKVVTADDKGILDFIGDYLLDGKDLLGHNRNDQPCKPGAMQFQHTASFAMLFQRETRLLRPLTVPLKSTYKDTHLPGPLTDYHPSLFRPPLA